MTAGTGKRATPARVAEIREMVAELRGRLDAIEASREREREHAEQLARAIAGACVAHIKHT